MNSRRLAFAAAVALMPICTVALSSASAAKPAYHFKEIKASFGQPGKCTAINNRAFTLNDHGSTGGVYYCHGRAVGFVKVRGGIHKSFIAPGGKKTDTYVQAIASNGDIALYASHDFKPPFSAYVASPANKYATLTPVVAPNAGRGGTVATGMNSHGVIVGYFYRGGVKSRTRAFVDDRGTFSNFSVDTPMAVRTRLSGINDKGDMVGEWFDGGNVAHPFLVKGGTVTYLNISGGDTLKGDGVFLQAIASNGDYAGVAAGHGKVSGFVYRNGVRTNLVYPNYGKKYTDVRSINRHGVVVGDFYRPVSLRNSVSNLAQGFVAHPR